MDPAEKHTLVRYRVMAYVVGVGLLVLVLVLGYSGFLDYDYEDDDENEPSPTFCKHALSQTICGFPTSPFCLWTSGSWR